MNHKNEDKDLAGDLNIARFPLDSKKSYHLTKTNEWVKNLLLELNEKAEEKDPEYYLSESSINVHLDIEKKYKGEIGEYLLVNGKVQAEFFTTCVRTLKEMKDQVEVEFKAAFIDEVHADAPEYVELTEVFLNQDVYELYFYKNRTAPLFEMIHEQIYLNVNQYPVLDDETPLDAIASNKGGTLH